MFRALVASLTFLALGSVVWAQDSADAKALKEEVAKLQDAYNAHDVEALIGVWGDDVDLISVDGSIYEGRDAISAAYQNQFERCPDIAIATEVFRVRALGNAAVVDGSTSISPTPETPAESTRFTAVYSRKGENDAWRLVSVREATLPPASAYDKLEPLGWLVGDWVNDSDQGRKDFTTIEWSEDGNELRRTSVGSTDDGTRRLTESRIFWNPTKERIESRTRDEDRVICGVWTREGDDWVVSTVELDGEGNKSTASYRMSPKGEKEMTVQKTSGEATGENASAPPVSVKRLD